jgi:hypothetical protein
VLIDESQDWPETERDLIYRIYGHRSVVIADGIDQFVRGVERVDWREGLTRDNSQIVSLTKSLRLKSSLCKAVSHFAQEIEYGGWNLEPVPEAHGGRLLSSSAMHFRRRFIADSCERQSPMVIGTLTYCFAYLPLGWWIK